MSVELGPLPKSDSRFMRRVRIHQAWFRASILGVTEFGYLAGSGAPCGSVLPDDAAHSFLNFHGGAAIHRYLDRRTKGWGVDPVRCMKYLTSSQTLTFNMLSEATLRPLECARLFNILLDRGDLEWLETSDFEFAAQGTHYSLGDKTLLDAMLRFKTRDGSTQIVAVETKLADRFSTRRTSGMLGDDYGRLARRSGVWRSLSAALADNRTRQLARCHALAESIQIADVGSSKHAVLLVLTHPEDEAAENSVASYTANVANQSVVHRSWSTFLAYSVIAGALKSSHAGELSRRYVDLVLSDASRAALEQGRPSITGLGVTADGAK